MVLNFSYINSFNVHCEVWTITIPILQMRKLRHIEVKKFIQRLPSFSVMQPGHTAQQSGSIPHAPDHQLLQPQFLILALLKLHPQPSLHFPLPGYSTVYRFSHLGLIWQLPAFNILFIQWSRFLRPPRPRHPARAFPDQSSKAVSFLFSIDKPPSGLALIVFSFNSGPS